MEQTVTVFSGFSAQDLLFLGKRLLEPFGFLCCQSPLVRSLAVFWVGTLRNQVFGWNSCKSRLGYVSFCSVNSSASSFL